MCKLYLTAQEIFYIVQGLFSGLSFLGSVLIVASSFTIPNLRKHPTTLVLYLSVCDLLFSLKYLVVALAPNSEDWEDRETHAAYCLAEAVWSQFFGTFYVVLTDCQKDWHP